MLISRTSLKEGMAEVRRWLVYSCAFLGTLAPNAVLALIPELRDFFQASTAEVLLSISFYMFFFAVFSLFTGSISDLIGRRRILLLGLATYAFGCLLTALSAELVLFYLSRIVQGLGFALVQPLLMAVLGDIVSEEEKGRTMGWLTAATTGGITLGPLLAGYASDFDWRWAFVIIAIMTAILAVLIFLLVSMPRSEGRTFSLRSLRNNIAEALGRRGVQMLTITGFLQVLVWIGTQAYASDRLGQEPFLASPALIGEVLAIAGFCSIVASRLGGSLADRIGRIRTVLLGGVIMVVPLLVMSTYTPSVTVYALLLAIFAVGSAISWSAQLTLAVEILPSLRGTVSSLFTSIGFTGGALSTIIFAPFQSTWGTESVHLISACLCGLMCLTIFMVKRDMASST